ncbi:hypothetical protein OK349_16095 [Sphingomonas sp. BT-65]|uniref:hypothetical protein n=1 Tax=Sphingomonas sp. BT-65 TaxID=2989821 RepID=UPI0022358E12|nr:hypothetical protein [Sphingomonas sp. BT-65]MCW4463235.1 hypothetical protein [Sphingomonas sp. BT-65]
MALRATGQARKAAGAIGRSLSTAYKRRQRNGEFRARWDAAVAAQQAAWIEAQGAAVEPGDPHERFDGWTRLRRRAFLRALSETGKVKDACERVGISDTSVYRLRKRSPGFARDFAAALARSAPMLEQIAWERAVEGWEEPVVVRGEVVGTRRRYSESLLRMLLREAHVARRIELAAEAKARPRGPRYATPEETDAHLMKLLDGVERRRRGEARLKALAEAEAWERLQAEAGDGEGLIWPKAGANGDGAPARRNPI